MYFCPRCSAVPADKEQLVKITVEELRFCFYHLNGTLILDMLMLFLNVTDSEIFEMVFFQLETEQLDLIIEV